MAYEFNDAENMVLGRVARWVGILAWIMIAGSGLMVLGSFLTGDTIAIAGLMVAPIYLIIGLNFRSAAASMKSVIETAGDDIAHLMEALEKLGSALMVMGVLFLLGVVVFGGSVVLLGPLLFD